MASVINTNLASLYAQKNLSGAQSSLSTAVERLSSGLRINRAKDDAAGLGISENIKQQINAINQGVRNANDAISMVQTAEGSLAEVSTILQRMKELSVQARNDSLSTVQRTYISDELVALKNEINAISERTTFNDISLAKNGLRTAVSQAVTGSNQLRNGASVLSDLTVSGLAIKNTNVGTYTLRSATETVLANQLSDVSQKFGGSEVDKVTFAGTWTAGDTIAFSVAIDDIQTVSATYTVTAQDIAADQSTGDDFGTRQNIARGAAALLSQASQAATGTNVAFSSVDDVLYIGNASGDSVITTTATVVSSNKDGKATATVSQGLIDQSARYVTIDVADATEGNRFELTINGKVYSAVATSGTTAEAIRNQVTNDLTSQLAAAYPGAGNVNHVDDAGTDDSGQIKLAAAVGLGLADISLKVYDLRDGDVVQNQASAVNTPSSTSSAFARTITLDPFDIVAGRKATVTIGSPDAYTSYSTVMSNSDTSTSVADRLATLINNAYGNTSDTTGVITITSSANLGMSEINLSFNDMVDGPEVASQSVVSAKNMANNTRSITINQNDLNVGNVVSVTIDGTEYATKVQAGDLAGDVAARLVGQIDDNYARVAGSVTTPTVAAQSEGTRSGTETNVVTFADMAAGETLIMSGVTFTAVRNLTATEVATAWASRAAATVLNTVNSAGNYTFSANAMTSWASGAASGASVTFTSATANTDVTNLTNTGTGKVASIVETSGGAADAYEVQRVTFGSAGMKAGDSITIAGLTFTAKRDVSQAEAAAAFGGLAASAESGDAHAYGTYSGQLSSGWATSAATTTTVDFTANSYGDKELTALGISSAKTNNGVSADAKAVTFSALTSGQTLIYGGLTLTAGGSGMTAAEVAQSFSSLVNGQSGGTSVPASATSMTGTYVGGYSTSVADGATVVFYSNNERNPALAGTDFTGTGTDPTVVDTQSNIITIGAGSGLGLSDISVTVKSVADAGTFTLTANDDTGMGGLSQSISMGTISAGGSKTMVFDKLGVTFTLNNARSTSVGASDFEVFSSSVDTLTVDSVGTGNALFQVGANTRDTVSIDGFKDIRIMDYNKNSGAEKDVFTRLSATLDLIAQNTTESLASENFATLETQIEDVITTVSDFRSYFGAQQNRIEFAIANLQAQSENLTAANSRIRDTDYAAETANLTKTQIMQQAATAMLAQANQMPNVILALLK
jgi:flagellin